MEQCEDPGKGLCPFETSVAHLVESRAAFACLGKWRDVVLFFLWWM